MKPETLVFRGGFSDGSSVVASVNPADLDRLGVGAIRFRWSRQPAFLPAVLAEYGRFKAVVCQSIADATGRVIVDAMLICGGVVLRSYEPSQFRTSEPAPVARASCAETPKQKETP